MNVSHINGLNSSLPGKNGHHFTDNIVRYIFVNEKFCILIKISLKFVAEGPVDNNPSLVKIMACRPKSRQAIIWTNADPICWCIYVALGETSWLISIWKVFHMNISLTLHTQISQNIYDITIFFYTFQLNNHSIMPAFNAWILIMQEISMRSIPDSNFTKSHWSISTFVTFSIICIFCSEHSCYVAMLCTKFWNVETTEMDNMDKWSIIGYEKE